MRDIPKKMIIPSSDAGVDAIIDLFELDLEELGGDILRFHSGVNGYYEDVIWQGKVYQAYPVSIDGLEFKSEGTYGKPSITVANLTGLMTGLNSDFNDILGARLIRHQVPVASLDAVNFPEGNPEADPTNEAISWYIVEEMSEETFERVTYKLAFPADCDNAIIPARTILADVCQWQYRGEGCRYDGKPVADDKDNPTNDPLKDRCSKHLSGCRLRYPRPLPLPYGGFPGSSKVS